jgi:hypothetical protein
LIPQFAATILVQLFGGDETAAFAYTDIKQYESYFTAISAQCKASKQFTVRLTYQDSIRLSNKLKKVTAVANTHPVHWIAFVAREVWAVDVLLALFHSDFDLDFIIAAAQLLLLGEVKIKDARYALRLLIISRSTMLRELISKLLLLTPEAVVGHLATLFEMVCNYGSRSEIFFLFLSEFLHKVKDRLSIVHAIVASIAQQHSAIQLLPNYHLYNQLAQYIDVNGSYFDLDPCTVCSGPERQLSKKGLLDYSEFSKYSFDKICLKFRQPILIKSISVDISGPRSIPKTPKTIRIFVSIAEIRDATALLSESPKCRHIADLTFPNGSMSASLALPLQTLATCVQFHFTEKWPDTSSTFCWKCPLGHQDGWNQQTWQCRCGENIYQCRNRDCNCIPVGHLGAPVCPECGTSAFG